MGTINLLDEINLIINEIRQDYPEIYRSLEEENFFLDNSSNLSISENDLNIYLESLKRVLDNYQRNHQDTIMVIPEKNFLKKNF